MPILHDLPRRVFDRPWGRRAFLLFAIGFTLAQVGFATYPLLPGQERVRMLWPMFIGAGRHNRWLSFEGVTDDGSVISIDVTRWLQYTRGFTNLRVHDIHSGLWKDTPSHQRHQRVFARWLARQVWLTDGVALREVRFQRHRERIRTGEVRHGRSRTIEIEPIDREQDIPRESGAARR